MRARERGAGSTAQLRERGEGYARITLGRQSDNVKYHRMKRLS
jgi:hypothetical protein